jgi:hypothetical protein
VAVAVVVVMAVAILVEVAWRIRCVSVQEFCHHPGVLIRRKMGLSFGNQTRETMANVVI